MGHTGLSGTTLWSMSRSGQFDPFVGQKPKISDQKRIDSLIRLKLNTRKDSLEYQNVKNREPWKKLKWNSFKSISFIVFCWNKSLLFVRYQVTFWCAKSFFLYINEIMGPLRSSKLEEGNSRVSKFKDRSALVLEPLLVPAAIFPAAWSYW